MKRLIYITGTSRGIGKAIAQQLVEEGDFEVVGMARNCTIEHENYRHVEMDLSNLEAVKEFKFHDASEKEKVVLLNNAGWLGPVKHIGDIDADSIEKAYNVNIVAPVILLNHFIEAYKKTPAEKLVINVTSGAAQNPYDGWGCYSPTKAGLDMLTKVVDLEQKLVESNKVKVLAVAPGVVETFMQETIRSADEESFSKKEKFLELKENDWLATTEQAAKKYVEIIRNPGSVESVISRVSY